VNTNLRYLGFWCQKAGLDRNLPHVFGIITFLALVANSVSYGDEKGKASPPPMPAELVSEERSPDSAEQILLYLKGRSAALEGKYDQAVIYLEQALKLDPNSVEILYRLSEVYLKVGNGEKAVDTAQRAVEKEPKNFAFRMSLGGIYASLRRYNSAKEQYKKATELNPSNQKVQMLLGIVEAELGEMDESISIFSKAIKENPYNEMAFFYRARIYLEMEKIKEAKKDLNQALIVRPSFREAGVTLGMLHERVGEIDKAIEVYNRIDGGGRYKKRLAQLYLSQKNYDKALKELEEYEQIEPDDFTAKVKIALIRFELKQYDKAATRFESILKVEPKSDNIRFYLAAVYEESKNLPKAIENYKKVSIDSSFYSQSVLHVGYIYKDLNQISQGIKFAKKVIRGKNVIPEFYDMYAAFYEYQKKYKKALATVGKGLKKYPDNEKLLYFEGALQDKLGNRKAGIENMKKILAMNDNNAHALNFLGYSYAEAGENLEEAEKLITKALKLRPEDGFIEDSMGWVLFKRGKVDEALERLQKAAMMQPEEAVIFEHLGDVYAKKLNIKKAVQMYQKAFDLAKEKDKEYAKKMEAKIAKFPQQDRLPSTEDEKK